MRTSERPTRPARRRCQRGAEGWRSMERYSRGQHDGGGTEGRWVVWPRVAMGQVVPCTADVPSAKRRERLPAKASCRRRGPYGIIHCRARPPAVNRDRAARDQAELLTCATALDLHRGGCRFATRALPLASGDRRADRAAVLALLSGLSTCRRHRGAVHCEGNPRLGTLVPKTRAGRSGCRRSRIDHAGAPGGLGRRARVAQER